MSKTRKLGVFIQVSLDGYYADADGDMSWAHKQDPEWIAFTEENAKGGGALLFGRVTYDMMASFWPTPAGRQMNAAVSERMTSMPKHVASRTLKDASWKNTKLLRGDLAEAVEQLKQEPGPDLVTLGSGSLVAQLTSAGLVDEYCVVVNPIILGAGKKLFAGVEEPVALELTRSKAFTNGNVVLWYAPQG